MDVVEAILVRSDVEDVLRCKSVCKSWYNLISTSYFVNKAHLKHSYHRNHEHGNLRIKLHHKLYFNYKLRFEIVGSCNGLVCISPLLPDYLLVTNPSTREVRKLPLLLPYKFYTRNIWGFGYDASTDDYKVVFGSDESGHHMRFQVLSLKSNKWKVTGDSDYLTYNAHLRFPTGVLYDGALHWFVKDMKKNKTVILSYDLSLDKFKEIPQPCDAKYVCHDDDDDDENTLGIFEGCLCIFRSYDFDNDHCHKWVMKKYNCWQMLPHDSQVNKYAAGTIAYLLDCTWRLCDDDKGNVEMSSQRWFNISAPIFVKSLVSPYLSTKPNNNNKRKFWETE